MVHNQHVVKRAQEEIDHVIGQDRLPTLEDRDRLPYIDCILKETLRCVYSLSTRNVSHRIACRWNPPVPLSMLALYRLEYYLTLSFRHSAPCRERRYLQWYANSEGGYGNP